MIGPNVTTFLDAPKDDVFEYLSNVETSDWATEFAQELRWEDGEATVTNALGTFCFQLQADRETGVIDMRWSGPTRDELALFPTRVIPLWRVAAHTPSRCSSPPACPTSSSKRSTSPSDWSSTTSPHVSAAAAPAARDRDRDRD